MGILRPATYPITIQAGATFELTIELGFDCNGKTVLAQLWNESRTRKLLNFEVVWIDLAIGRFTMKADWEITRTLAEPGIYDVLVIDEADGDRDYYLRGEASLDTGYTEEPAP
jgi:hypothetical protein